MTLLVVRMIEEQYHRDVEGRPIRESRTPPQFLREGDIEHRTCMYPGQRYMHPKPMNVSALRQMGAHWDEVTDALAWLRARYDAALGAHAPGFLDLWRQCQLAASLAWRYLFDGKQIPAYSSALAKATQGMGIWAQLMFARQMAERWQPPALTAEVVLELAVKSETLIGDHEVCSAGDKMLLKFF